MWLQVCKDESGGFLFDAGTSHGKLITKQKDLAQNGKIMLSLGSFLLEAEMLMMVQFGPSKCHKCCI
jgi:hypothetical protein